MTTQITPLSAKGRRLLKAIVGYLKINQVDYMLPSTYPTYESLYRVIVPNAPAKLLYVGHHLRKKGLDDLNTWTMKNKSLPKVTGLIVNGTKGRPNDRFFACYKKTPVKHDDWWREEARKALVFDWSPFIGTQQAASPAILADDLDEHELARRVKGEVSRIIRDTKIVRRVKALHDHTCQLCGLRLELSSGLFYSEAHHLMPLGNPHDGPDRLSNIICVCPNCHVKLDYHAVRIQSGQLKPRAGHAVSQKFIDHHNNLCF